MCSSLKFLSCFEWNLWQKKLENLFLKSYHFLITALTSSSLHLLSMFHVCTTAAYRLAGRLVLQKATVCSVTCGGHDHEDGGKRWYWRDWVCVLLLSCGHVLLHKHITIHLTMKVWILTHMYEKKRQMVSFTLSHFIPWEQSSYYVVH